jgi:hypothetical protein
MTMITLLQMDQRYISYLTVHTEVFVSASSQRGLPLWPYRIKQWRNYGTFWRERERFGVVVCATTSQFRFGPVPVWCFPLKLRFSAEIQA